MTTNSNGGFYDAGNSSKTPLLSNEFYNGKFASSLNFSVIEISIFCDSTYNLEIIYSPDGINDEFIETTTLLVVSNETLFYKFEPKMRYFKVRLENTGDNQNYLSLQCILKSSFIYELINNLNQNVNIISPLSGGGVLISNPELTNIYNVVNSKGFKILWSGVSTGIGGLSAIVNLSDKNVKNLTFMGNCDNATIITVQFSNDNLTYYDSQYSYNLSSAGDFGFNIACCPYYTRLKSSLDVIASVIINYC